MREPKWETATEEEVWKYVAWHLAKNGIDTILVGGAVAAIYSEGIYKSGANIRKFYGIANQIKKNL